MKHRHGLVFVGALAGMACAQSLGSLVPFPCAEDGTCPTGFECSPAKECECPAGSSLCGGNTCIDLQTDVHNCGACGIDSPTGFCSNGCPVPTKMSRCVPSPFCGCGAAENCDFASLTEGWQCEPAGPAAAGEACSNMVRCMRGLTCVSQPGSPTDTCTPYCNPNLACSATEYCTPLEADSDGGRPVGGEPGGMACFPSGS